MSVGSFSELRSSYQDCGVWHSARLYEKFARELVISPHTYSYSSSCWRGLINICDCKAEGSFKPAWSPGTHSNYIFVVFTDFLRLLDEWRVDQWNWMGTFKVDRLIYKVTQPAGAWGGFCRRKPYITSLQTFGSFSNCIIIKKLWCRVENRSLG